MFPPEVTHIDLTLELIELATGLFVVKVPDAIKLQYLLTIHHR